MRLTTNISELIQYISSLIKNNENDSANLLMKDSLKESSRVSEVIKFKYSTWLINKSSYSNFSEAINLLTDLEANPFWHTRVCVLKAFGEYKYRGNVSEEMARTLVVDIEENKYSDRYYIHFYYLLALYYQELRDFENWKFYLLKSIEFNPSASINNALMGDYYQQVNDPIKAAHFYGKALSNIKEIIEEIPPTDWSDIDNLIDEYFNGIFPHRLQYKLLSDKYNEISQLS